MEVVTGNRIIEQIHADFFSMDNLTDTKVQKELKIAYNKDRQQINQTLVSMGFFNTKSSEVFKEEVVNINEELNDLLNEYSMSYPGYKFITDEQITILCKKYHLYLTIPNKFIGEIPLKNQKDITNFKSKHPQIKKSFLAINEKSILFIKSILNKESTARSILAYGFGNNLILMTRALNYYYNITMVYPKQYSLSRKELTALQEIVSSLNISIKITELSSEFFIAATLDLLNTVDLVPNNKNELTIYSPSVEELTEAEISDPIVFKKVKKGAIIVTAWGEEAADPLVLNPLNN